jgi:hypothetical protein
MTKGVVDFIYKYKVIYNRFSYKYNRTSYII